MIHPRDLIEEVRITLATDANRVLAFASLTYAGVAVHELKLIESSDGRVFLSMPSRKLCDKCPRCGRKNWLVAHFCQNCGNKLAEKRAEVDEEGREILHADVVHPIRSDVRTAMANAVIEAYNAQATDRKPLELASSYRGLKE